ncbi:MAG: PstS family phosphate ABC transporter substrate-binding protein [Phycisphaerales bacterium]|nr:PstS family phosphate ABC transporter substrate-binding protein [Phycisphaerales bacterium]
MALMNKCAAVIGGLGITASVAMAQTSTIRIDGSSTVYPVTEAVVEEFSAASRGKVKLTIGVSGTGGGFKKFARGEIDISNASRPISTGEMEEAAKNGVEYLELPVCFDALTVVVNTQNDWAKTMTVAELKKIWEPGAQGTITKWNQIRPEWPNEKIDLYGPGTDSGTFDYFTEAVCGKAKASRGDYAASEDDNVLVQGVEGSKFSLGYFGFSYFSAHAKRLTPVAIDNGKGGVLPSNEAVIAGTYNPLSRPLFIYVNKKALQERPEVKQFVEFYLENVKELAAEVKYTPLPDSAYEAVKSRFAKLQAGTVFGGHSETGLTIDDIVKRETKTGK